MSYIDDGGPAFPMSGESGVEFDRGMSLRDWFAGQALAGVWAGRESDFSQLRQPTANDVATSCYLIADAMLAARKKDMR